MKKLFYVSFFLFYHLCLSQLLVIGQVDYEKLDDYLAKAVADYNVPGLAIAIVKDGNMVFSQGYGLREVGTEKPITPNSIFSIASCSKAFTATCIGMLVDEGKLNWDDRVIDHLPDFQLHDAYVTRELRVRDLLCHRAGFDTFDGDLLWYGTHYDREEVIRRIRFLPLKNSFRSRFGYSNVMFITAGEVIEAVSGMTWDEFVQKRLMEPLGMKDATTTNQNFKKKDERALPHLNGIVVEDINYDNSGPAASLNASVTDLSKWLTFWLGGGKYGDKQLLSPESWREILSAQTAQNPSNLEQQMGIHFESYALGWRLFDYAGRKVVEHDGGLPGYISKVAFIPEENLGVVILTNGMPAVLNMALRNEVFDRFLNGKESDWAGRMLSIEKNYLAYVAGQKAEREKTQITGTQPSLPPADYSGKYEDKMYGPAEVVIRDGKLFLTLLPTSTLFTGELRHWHYNTFRVDFADPFLPFGLIVFEMDSQGKVTGFTIDLPNPDFNFYNLKFEKE
ncbi:MAG: serine hydrolase [Bacteroidia bacterium]|nr:serine hydrolase [Bacteroidia bacterium]